MKMPCLWETFYLRHVLQNKVVAYCTWNKDEPYIARVSFGATRLGAQYACSYMRGTFGNGIASTSRVTSDPCETMIKMRGE